MIIITGFSYLSLSPSVSLPFSLSLSDSIRTRVESIKFTNRSGQMIIRLSCSLCRVRSMAVREPEGRARGQCQLKIRKNCTRVLRSRPEVRLGLQMMHDPGCVPGFFDFRFSLLYLGFRLILPTAYKVIWPGAQWAHFRGEREQERGHESTILGRTAARS